MVVSVGVEISVPDDGTDGTHNRRRLGGDELIVVTQDYAYFRSFQSVMELRLIIYIYR